MSLYNIHILSDSLGETAEQVANAAACQFSEGEFKIWKYSYIQTSSRIKQILSDIEGKNNIVIFTVILDSLRDYIIKKCKELNLLYVDVITPVIEGISNVVGENPIYEPGSNRKLDDDYFSRIQAVEFAVKYDDGKDPRGIKKADCVIIGVSRTSKTPLSMYLAHKNIKVANIPLVPELEAPIELFEIDPKKIFCLTNDKNVLNRIRTERLKELGLRDNSNYASLDRIAEELEYAKKLSQKIGCKVINVANKAIEETSNIVERALYEKSK